MFRWRRQFYFCNGMSDGFLDQIRFCFHLIIPFFDYFVCSCDQLLLERHDIGAWSFLPGLIQNQSNFTGKFHLVYSLFPQQSSMRNKSPMIQSFSFKYCFITQTWSNYPFLASLGKPSGYNNRNFAWGYLTDIFYINRFHQLKRTTKILQGVSSRSFFFSTWVTPESESAFNSAKKQ